MNKYLIVLLVQVSLSYYQVAEAQSKLSLGIGGELSYPASEHFIRNVNMGTGISGLVQYAFTESFALIGMVGYLKWPPGDEDIILQIGIDIPTISVKRTAHFSAFPILIGIKGYFNRGNIRVFCMVLVGTYKMTVEAQSRPAGYVDVAEVKEGRATIGLGLGFELHFNKFVALDLSGRYQFIPDFIDGRDASNYGFRAGLLFGI